MVLVPSGTTLWFTDPADQVNVTIPPVVTAASRGEKELLATVTVVVEPAASAGNVIGDPLTPLALAGMVIVPGEPPSVTVVDATPEASVGPEVGSTLPPPLTTVQVTVVPATGCPPSVIFTRSKLASTAPTWS